MSKYIKTLKYNDGSTTYTVDTRSIKDADNAEQTLKQKLDSKANTSGTYSGLSVGYATTAGSAATAVKATAADDADTLDGKHASELQELLVSGTNIKTVNSKTLLGEGDVLVGVVETGSTSPTDTGVSYWIDTTDSSGEIVQTTGTSLTNPMSQNAITTALGTKQASLGLYIDEDGDICQA